MPVVGGKYEEGVAFFVCHVGGEACGEGLLEGGEVTPAGGVVHAAGEGNDFGGLGTWLRGMEGGVLGVGGRVRHCTGYRALSGFSVVNMWAERRGQWRSMTTVRLMFGRGYGGVITLVYP